MAQQPDDVRPPRPAEHLMVPPRMRVIDLSEARTGITKPLARGAPHDRRTLHALDLAWWTLPRLADRTVLDQQRVGFCRAGGRPPPDLRRHQPPRPARPDPRDRRRQAGRQGPLDPRGYTATPPSRCTRITAARDPARHLMREAMAADPAAAQRWTPVTAEGQALGRHLGLGAASRDNTAEPNATTPPAATQSRTVPRPTAAAWPREEAPLLEGLDADTAGRQRLSAGQGHSQPTAAAAPRPGGGR